ncbi:hypothetical protein ACFP1I_03440 [Dyadobacter subterraneus]|uniref:Uncharacterized protein n=1 Tax=Dyadobacter subterraneus TaxID=2773304 RepID=A0ABR9W4G2_9BACT|nr:hypothetical protein [Dyadobacter subterraneus]MBE9460350.1 hypothetical protein [Dyadobacter subterraneus]
MKSLESKVVDKKPMYGGIFIDKSLNDVPISPAAQRKNDEARAFLEKHPIPDHILNRHRSDK